MRKAILTLLVVVSLLIVALPTLDMGVEAVPVQTPRDWRPSSFINLTDETTIIPEVDYLNFWLYDQDIDNFTSYSLNLTDPGWKDDAIEILNNTIVNPTPDWYVCAFNETQGYMCDIREEAWEYQYPYVSEAYNQLVATVLEVIIEYFDPWEYAPSLLVSAGLIVVADSIAQKMYADSDPALQEPYVMLAVNSLFREYVRDTLIGTRTNEMTDLQHTQMMFKTLILWNDTVDNLYSQEYFEPQNYTDYALATIQTLDWTQENITELRDDFNFKFWWDSNDQLSISLEILRDGIVDWAFRLNLKHYVGWLFSGRLSGYVYDPLTDKALSGATITARKVNDELVIVGTTDSSGRFSIRLPRGEYEITVFKKGYAGLRYNLNIFPWKETDLNVALESEAVTLEEAGEKTIYYAGLGLIVLCGAGLGLFALFRSGKIKFKKPKRAGGN